MKTKIVKSIVLVTTVAVFGLVGCASNTRSENTTIGAVSGAVIGGAAGSLIGAGTGQVVAIGVGAVAGALIGGAIGNSMDSSDNQMAYTAMRNPTNHPAHWTNRRSHHMYTVVPTSGYMTVNGNPKCRQFKTVAMIDGQRRHVHGVACMQSNGMWQTVSP